MTLTMMQYTKIKQMESIVDSKERLHFFEYLEVDMLQQYLRTGIGYFVNAVLNSHPSLVPLRYWNQEITALIDFLKDFVALATQRATYAEGFFGFQRGQMSKWGALKGALIWTILPYLANKLDNYYNQLVGDEIDGKRLKLLQKILKEIYPYLYAVVGLLQTFHKFRYLYQEADKEDRWYHLFYRFQKLHLKRSSSQQETGKYPILQLFKKPGLMMLLMGHKVLTWYFTQKKEKKVRGPENKVEVSPPMPEEDVKENGYCSICTKKLKNPTMVKQTGYVYCLECIGDYVQREKRCPLGGIEVQPEQLQILYG